MKVVKKTVAKNEAVMRFEDLGDGEIIARIVDVAPAPKKKRKIVNNQRVKNHDTRV